MSVTSTTAAPPPTAQGAPGSAANAPSRANVALVIASLLIGPLALLFLRLAPAYDYKLQSPAAHFWIVTGATIIAMLMVLLVIRAAVVRRDGRAFLIGMAFLFLSDMFFVHAVSTPNVLFTNTRHATQWSTPLALLAAAILLALSSSDRVAGRPTWIKHWKRWLAAGLLIWLTYAAIMIAYIPHQAAQVAGAAAAETGTQSVPDADPIHAGHEPAEAAPVSLQQQMIDLAPRLFPFILAFNIALYAYAALGYGRRWRQTPTRPLACLIIGAILLAETALAAQYGVIWQISFWSYHVLLAAAVISVTYGVVRGVEKTGSLSSSVEGLLLGETLERQQQGFRDGMTSLLDALEHGNKTALADLRRDLGQRFGLAEDQLDLLQHAVSVVAQDREQGRRLQALVDISHTVTLDLDPDQLLHDVVTTLAKTTHPTLAGVGVVEGKNVVLRPEHHIIKGQPAAQTVTVPLAGLPLKWLLATDVPYNARLDGDLAVLDIDGGEALLVPLSHHTQLLGVLIFQPATPDIDARTESVLQSVAAHLATALANAQLFQKLREEHTQLLRSEQVREQMNQLIVHDLKNPLTAIVNYLDILKRDAMSTTQLDLIEGARRSTRTLIGLVSDLLDTARLQEGRLALRPDVINLRELLANSISDLQTWAAQDNKTLKLKAIDPDLLINVDGDLLGRVLANLISNAIKHTPRTTVIAVGATHNDRGVYLSVEDNGPGIPAELQATLFERFAQVNANSNGRQRNTGLGLHFCKLAVEAHGGTISVRSAPPHGTTFLITLPPTVLAPVREHAGGR